MSDWNQQSVPFKFRVGEWTMFKMRRKLAVRSFNVASPTGHLPDLTELPARLDNADLDGLLLRSVSVEQELFKLTLLKNAVRYVPQQYKRYFVDLALSSEEYLSKFSSKTRATLRRKTRKFSKASGGSIDWREYRTSREMKEFYQSARDVSSKTYQEVMLDAGLPQNQKFQQEMLESAERDEVRGYLLFFVDKPIAYLYCPIRDGVVMYEYLGYLPDEQYSRLSPGTVLLWLVLQRLFDGADQRFFDFTEGSERSTRGHKGMFSTGYRSCADVFLLKRTPSNIALVTLHAGVDSLSELVGSALERIGLKRQVRRLLRAVRGAG